MKKKKGIGEISWILGIVLCSLGVCLSTKSGFGVSMVVAPSYIIFTKLSPIFPFMTFGFCEYCFQGLLIVLLVAITGKFKWKYLLSFLTAVIYGFAIDLWQMLFGIGVAPTVISRMVFCISGAVITSISIALFLRTYLPQESYEIFVKDIVERFNLKMNTFKWIYDISSLCFAIVLMVLLFGEWRGELVGIGTFFLTVVNAPLIAFFGKIFDKFFDFVPRFPQFAKIFNKYFN